MSAVVLTPELPTAAVPVAAPPVAPPFTAALTQALRNGDEAAWREFHAAYAPRLLRYLLVVCAGREEAAREALQGTLLRAVKHVRIFATEPELWGWLTVLARSAAADAGRRERRYLGFLDRWFRQQPAPVVEPTEPDERLQSALADELARLSAEERDLLERKYVAGEAVRELAGTLGTTEKAVESRLTRARQKLKTGILARLHHEEHP